MARDLGQEISEDQLHNLIKVADSLQHAERRNPELDREVDEMMALRQDLQQPLEGDMKPLTLESAYEIAKEQYGIEPRFIDKAMSLHYPSPKQQLEDVRNHNGIPTRELIKNVCDRELLKSLRGFSPLEKFDCFGPYECDEETGKYIISGMNSAFVRIREEEKSRLIRKPKKISVYDILAEYERVDLKNSGLRYEIELKNPLFLHACGDTLKRLKNKTFKELFYYEVKHDYIIE